MTPEEIEEIIENLFIKHSCEDGFGYDVMYLSEFKQAFLEGIGEIQRRQEPVRFMCKQYGDVSVVDRIGWVPLFTFPPAEQKCECKVPDGWQLVPKEPTPEMRNILDFGIGIDDTESIHSHFQKEWEAILSVAPKPPE